MRRRLKTTKAKADYQIRVKMGHFASGRPDTNNYREITKSLYCFENNFPYEADYAEWKQKPWIT